MERREQDRDRHDDREECHRPPDDPPRARPKSLQDKRRYQPRRQNTDARSGIEQAEQKIRPLGTRLRDHRGERAAANKSGRRADAGQKPRKTQHVEIVCDGAQRQREHAG
jgi:hypothetical protein